MRPQQVLPLWVKVDLGVMAMKEYSTFPKIPGLESHHQMALRAAVVIVYSLTPSADCAGNNGWKPTQKAGLIELKH